MTRRQSNTSSIRPAFSMVELMIAIVILGLGLLMLATMFPVAWTRARDMSEFTVQSSVGDMAAITVEAETLVRTGDRNSSFVGDIDGSGVAGDPPGLPLVHQLNMETVLAVPPTMPIPLRPEFFEEASAGDDVSMDALHAPTGYITPFNTFAKIPIHERVIPQMPPPPVATAPPALRLHWEQRLAARRFAWAVFHRFDTMPTSLTDPRLLTMYYVTLRRPESTNRYVRQERIDGVGLATQEPTALPPAEDVRFPFPWLIHLDVRGSWEMSGVNIGAALPPTGIASEAIAGGDDDSRLIAQMLQRGSILIDRLTGAVYTVKSHRYTKSAANDYDNTAVVTLDREIHVADIETKAIQLLEVDPLLADGKVQVGVVADAANPLNPVAGRLADGTIRPFWTFPPPIERTGSNAEDFVFVGKQPVVGVEIRHLQK